MKKYSVIVRNGRIVEGDRVYAADICVSDGKIRAIEEGADASSAEAVIDAEGKYVLPGAVDSHAHLNDPGFTWREDYGHGTAAAAVGGVTTIVDMPLQNEPAMTDAGIMAEKLAAVSAAACVDYCFWGGLTDYNFDKLAGLRDAGCGAFKSFIGPVSPDYVSLGMGPAREALQIIGSLDARAGFHCEDYSLIKWGEESAKRRGDLTWRGFLDSRPVVAELIATQNIIELSRETGTKIHICHVSHPDVAEAIRRAQIDGVDVTAETCPHYLVFSEEDVINHGSVFKCAPPLRSAASRERLWDYVASGVLSCVGSDHSPCAIGEKSEEEHGVFGAWGGISGIQSLMQVMYAEGVEKRGHSVTLLARLLAEGPARAFGIYGRKGALRVGFDADLVILDPRRSWEITADSLHYLNKFSAFVGLRGVGYPELTMVRGKVTARDGAFVGTKGFGEFVKSAPPALPRD